MVLAALTLRPLPREVADRIADFARELCVDESMIGVARQFASGSLGLAAIDFERNGYTSEWRADDAHALHTSTELASAWDASVHDPGLAARWAALETLAPDSLGRRVWELYRSRGFSFPGTPAPRRRSWPSTIGCTCSPTSGPPSSPSSRCSASSPAPTTTCAPSRCSPWSSRCSRPATSEPARGCSSIRSVTCPPTATLPFASLTRW